ncbi:hypothetical protein Q5P01_002781 [Channa striata]|uniref:Uncharacterized protein n=1 Tax=Channa striata TaxID=64152 RepID=A0AA88NTS6_CHASR|nr:hypothetical protein Q5P01_002781 [Channa striata]
MRLGHTDTGQFVLNVAQNKNGERTDEPPSTLRFEMTPAEGAKHPPGGQKQNTDSSQLDPYKQIFSDCNEHRVGFNTEAFSPINDGGDSETKPGLKMTTGRAQEQEDSGHFITTIVALFLVLVVVVCFGLIVSGHHRILAARICGDK